MQNDDIPPPVSGRKKKISIPRNSLKFYRRQKDVTQEQLAKAIGTNYQTIEKYENLKVKLSHSKATEIAAVLNVPAGFLGFSYDEDPYSYAVKAVPVIGTVDHELRINFAENPIKRIGMENLPSGLCAVELGPHAMTGFQNWLLIYDPDARERVSDKVLNRQRLQSAHYFVKVKDGDMWWRQITPSVQRNLFHLAPHGADGKSQLYDCEIEYVCEVLRFEGPGRELPPSDE